jgi:hypothetical protein
MRFRVSSLAISGLLAIGLLLTAAGSGLAISGFATNGPAVRAQYPDERDLAAGHSTHPTVSNLGDMMRSQRAADAKNPKAAARRRAAERTIDRRVAVALPRASGLSAAEYGSIPLLAMGIAVLSMAGVLRWRRGQATI